MEEPKKPRRKRKVSKWRDHPDDLPHERARRAVNRMVYGVDTKMRIADD